MSYPPFDTIVISGGCVNGFAVLGCIYEMQNRGIIALENVNTYAGVSSGSMISLLLILGFTPLEIIQKVLSSNVLEKVTKTMNMANVWNGTGLFDYSPIHDTLMNTIIDKHGYIPTMKDIREKFHKRLIVIAFNETKDITEVFDSDNETYDSLLTLHIIRCSSNLPWVFSEFSLNGNMYIDGGLTDNFPLHLVDKRGSNIIGFITRGSEGFGHTTINKIFKRMKAPIAHIIQIRIADATPRCKIVEIPTSVNVTNLNVSNSQIMDLVGEGKKCVDGILEKWVSDHRKKD